VLAETDASGNITAYYIYGLGLISKITPSDESYFYHYDGLGSIVAMTDSSGSVVNKYSYDAYGKVVSQVEAVSNPFKYVGLFGVMDEGNGLLYMRARYYDPEMRRFLNKDPIGFLGGLNMYSYVQNNPVNFVDLNGKTAQEVELAIKIALPLIFGAIELKNPAILFAMGYGGDLLEILSGGSGILTAEIILAGSPSAPILLPFGLALASGLETGLAADRLYGRISGQPFGADIYDWLYSGQEGDRTCR
jgi:RHS repeat-associated protein